MKTEYLKKKHSPFQQGSKNNRLKSSLLYFYFQSDNFRNNKFENFWNLLAADYEIILYLIKYLNLLLKLT